MTNTSKLILAPALAIAVALPLSVPANAGEKASAGQNEGPIVVRSQLTMEEWQEQMSRDLDRKLAHAPATRTLSMGSGIVQVSFTMGADGKADNLELYSNSANWLSKRTAMRAVRRLDNLSAVPVDDPQNARFLANIIIASDQETHDKLAAKLAKSERKRLAAADDESEYIALGG
ncbi:MAG: hypothetical protein AAGK02_04260 [Pseudomonadota bacterium]